jgi:hypothetical protein
MLVWVVTSCWDTASTARNDKRIYGGYLSYDNRNTGNSVFNQVGAGFESLGDRWDFRVNGYAPLGDSRQMVNERVLDTGLQLTGNPFFQDHFLVAQGQRQFQQIRHFEAAMAGFDVEAGARLAKLGSQGDLRGYGGLYYYNASGSNDALGWRLRLEARPTDALNLGLSVQNDAIFGTNVVLSVGATFPGTRPRGVSKQESVLARMGESVVRTASIVVDSQTESKSFSEPVTVKASNPETGSPYLFQQVKLGQLREMARWKIRLVQSKPPSMPRSLMEMILSTCKRGQILAFLLSPFRVGYKFCPLGQCKPLTRLNLGECSYRYRVLACCQA